MKAISKPYQDVKNLKAYKELMRPIIGYDRDCTEALPLSGSCRGAKTRRNLVNFCEDQTYSLR